MKYPVLILGKHRSSGKDTFLKSKKIYQDEKGIYIRNDKSTWYVKIDEGICISIEYRSYEG